MTDLDRIRSAALARIDRRERGFKLALAGAVLAEAVLLGTMLFLTDLSDPIQRLILVSSVLVYTTLALGLAALGAHVSRTSERVVAALELLGAGSAALPRAG
jgi:hypothetical protein